MTRNIFGLFFCLALGFASTVSQAALIEVETNNTIGTANAIVRTYPNFADAGVLSLAPTGGDVDVMSIDLAVGDFIYAATTGISGLPIGDNPDTMLGLFDPTGVLLAYDDDSGAGSYGSELTYPIATAGTYYLAISGYPDGFGAIGTDQLGDPGVFDGSHSETGSYFLNVTVIAIPEPGVLALAFSGLAVAFRVRRRIG